MPEYCNKGLALFVLRGIRPDTIIIYGRQVNIMSITGYYDGTAVRINGQLQMNQKVIVIPVENEENLAETAAGGLHKYADPTLIDQEKDAWRKAAEIKHVKE